MLNENCIVGNKIDKHSMFVYRKIDKIVLLSFLLHILSCTLESKKLSSKIQRRNHLTKQFADWFW